MRCHNLDENSIKQWPQRGHIRGSGGGAAGGEDTDDVLLLQHRKLLTLDLQVSDANAKLAVDDSVPDLHRHALIADGNHAACKVRGEARERAGAARLQRRRRLLATTAA